MTVPELSAEQRKAALKRANEVRHRRANLKRDLKAGRRSVLDVLRDPDDYVLNMKVWDLLLAVPKYGRVKVNKALVEQRISPSRTVGGLTDRQRRELCQCIMRAPGGRIGPNAEAAERFVAQMSTRVHEEAGVGVG